MFNSTVQRHVVRVPIVQDAFSEGTEQFRASLSLVESNIINVALSRKQATVNIDDEGTQYYCELSCMQTQYIIFSEKCLK